MFLSIIRELQVFMEKTQKNFDCAYCPYGIIYHYRHSLIVVATGH